MDNQLQKGAVAKTRGLRHLFDALRYSWGGLKRLSGEPAFRQEIVGYAIVTAVLLLAGAAPLDHLVTLVLFLVLFAMEAINTAIEELVDRVSPEFSDMARHAKDLGSFAVACLLAAIAAWTAWSLYRLLA